MFDKWVGGSFFKWIGTTVLVFITGYILNALIEWIEGIREDRNKSKRKKNDEI